MISAIAFEVLVIFLLVAANGLFSMAEMAVVSSRKTKLRQMANEGNLKAKQALELAESPSRFLSTIQVGITLIGILAGAFGGITIAEQIALRLNVYPFLIPYSETIGVGVVVLGITLVSLILGELVPKQLALQNPEWIASLLAKPMNSLSRMVSPVIRFLSYSTESVLRIMGLSNEARKEALSEEEIQLTVEEAVKEGIFPPLGQEMVNRMLHMGCQKVSAMMVPRTEIVWLDINDPPWRLFRKIYKSGYIRFLVCQGSIDNILGVIHLRDILRVNFNQGTGELKRFLHKPLLVPENLPAMQMFERFRKSPMHFAIVLDEAGSVHGLVTMGNLFRALAGDYILPDGNPLPHASKGEDGSWEMAGTIPVEEVRSLLHLKELHREPRKGYETLAGFILAQLQKIPEPGMEITWQGYRFIVLSMKGKRIDRVRIVPVKID
jgi:putative hemolysin